jgi:two-component system nitrogen regulation response regulator NtrX
MVPHEGNIVTTLAPAAEFMGISRAAATVREQIARAAAVDAPVLVVGESGVGKELVARGIHDRSNRAPGPFVALNCAAIPDGLVESELFGHEPGSFTDGKSLRRGAFELADRGTLFLDEVGDLSPLAQPKLLRSLESGEFLRVGGEQIRRSDLRIIAATNHDLHRMSVENRFRADLLYRLRVIEIRVPSLRHRREDIPMLADRFARHFAATQKQPFRGFSPEAIQALTRYPWPGNVRELRSVVQRALSFRLDGLIDGSVLDLDPVSAGRIGLRALLDEDWKNARRKFESAYASHLLGRFGGSVREAAHAAGLAPRSLYKMLRRQRQRRGDEE